MFINFNIYKKHNLTPEYLIQLLAVKQKQTEEINTDVLGRFEELGYVTYTKGKKNQDIRELVRLSDKGKKLLTELEEAETEEQDKTVFEWLKNYYLKADKEIGNGAKTLRHIRDFRVKSGIEKNNLIKLVLDFLAENEERSKKLEYIWYYPKTAFATKFDLEESWLWNHFIKNRERLEKTFEEY